MMITLKSENTEFIEDIDRIVWRIDYNYEDPDGNIYPGIYEAVGHHDIDTKGHPKTFTFWDDAIPDRPGSGKSSPTATIPFDGTIQEYLMNKGREDIIDSNRRFIKDLNEEMKRLKKDPRFQQS